MDDYLAWDAAHEEKHEFCNGEMWAMAGAHPIHALIAGNLTFILGNRLRGSGCRPFASKMRVQIEETGLYCYPDLTIVCGRLETADTNPPTLLNPKVIVEVLSPSTAAFDKNEKFAHYRRRASVEAIVFVSWPARRVEHYGRDGDGWRLIEARDAETLPIPCLGVTLPLDEVYDGMDDMPA